MNTRTTLRTRFVAALIATVGVTFSLGGTVYLMALGDAGCTTVLEGHCVSALAMQSAPSATAHAIVAN